MGGRRWLLGATLALAALLVVGRVVAGWYVDFLWYDAGHITSLNEALRRPDLWRLAPNPLLLTAPLPLLCALSVLLG